MVPKTYSKIELMFKYLGQKNITNFKSKPKNISQILYSNPNCDQDFTNRYKLFISADTGDM
jgi:hypothetical protein